MSLSKIFVNNSQITNVDNNPIVGSENLIKSEGVYPAFGILFDDLEQSLTEKPDWYILDVNDGIGTIEPYSTNRTTHYFKCYKEVKYEIKINGRSSLWQENDKIKIGIADHIINQTEQISVLLSQVPKLQETVYTVIANFDGYLYVAHLKDCAIISVNTSSRLFPLESKVSDLENRVFDVEGQVIADTESIDISSLSEIQGAVSGNKWHTTIGGSTNTKHSIVKLVQVWDTISIKANSNGNQLIFFNQVPQYPIVDGSDVEGIIETYQIPANTLKECNIPLQTKCIYVIRKLYGNDYTPVLFSLSRNSIIDKIQDLNEKTSELELYHKDLPFENIKAAQYLDARANGELYARAAYFYTYYFLSEDNKTYKIVNHCSADRQSDTFTIGYCENVPAAGSIVSIVSRYIPNLGDNITIISGNGKYICCSFYIRPNTISVYTIPYKEVAFDHISVPAKLYAIKYNSNGFNLLNRLYVEGIVNNDDDKDITIDGAPSILAEEENPTIVGNKTVKAVVNLPDGYPYNMNISVQRVNPTSLQNKNVRIAHIGDSLTDQGVSCVSDFIIKCLNQDYGNISAVFVGNKNDTATIKLGNYEFICKTSNAGTGGWSISDYLRKIVHVNYGGTTGGGQDTMPGKVAWDSLGLATKTRNGVSERHSKVEFAASTETCYAIRNATHGWYDADPSAELWDWIVNKRGISSFTYDGTQYTFGSSYSSSDNATQIAAIKYLCSENWFAWNSNPFFDIDTVESSNGQYAFNYAKYLSRYKTLADDGVTRLVVGDTAGTRISDVMSCDLCTPSHVCLVMSTNGGIEAADAEQTVDDLILCGDLIKEVDNTIKVIIGSPHPYGFCNPQLYTDSGCFKHYNFNQRLFNCNEILKKKISASSHMMIDLYAIQNPGGTFKKTAFDLLDGNEKIRDVGDLTHAGELIGYIDRAYQFVGAIISTLS